MAHKAYANPASEIQTSLIRRKLIGLFIRQLGWWFLLTLLILGIYGFNGLNISKHLWVVAGLIGMVTAFCSISLWLAIKKTHKHTNFYSFAHAMDVKQLNHELEKIKQHENPDIWHRKFSILWLFFLIILIWGGSVLFSIVERQKAEVIIQESSLGSLNSEIVDSPTPLDCNGRFPYKPVENCTVIIKTPNGHGTGFSPEKGYVVTNWHVIEDASTFYTTLNNIDYELKYWGHTEDFDLAVLKLDESVPIGKCKWFDSGKLLRGDKVGLLGWGGRITHGEAAMAEGIYSRMINLGEDYDHLQTDVPVNKGNSGGPLYNGCGIVGVVQGKSLWLDENTPPEGIGFAIPSSIAQVKVNAIIQGSTGQLPPLPTIAAKRRTKCAHLLNQDASRGIVKILDDYIVCIDKRLRYWDGISRDNLSTQSNQRVDELVNLYRQQFDLCFRLQNRYIDNDHEATTDEVVILTTIRAWSDQIENLEGLLGR